MIYQTTLNGKSCLKFTIADKLNKQEAIKMCSEWKALAASNTSGKYIIIFDAVQMTDYEPMSRVVFQETINALKMQIDAIWVITNSKIISAGASLMSLFTSFKIKSVTSENQIVA